ncbi:MAG: hypothetical protein EPN93_17490 [Spirochaetes bacterium]|nr:MAG: hypothetical protein EPN93_17490 [Spirochaetota bacterium]
MDMAYEPLTDTKLAELQSRIDGWKAKFGDQGGIRSIEVPDEEGDDFSGIFRVPTKDDLERSSRKELSNMESDTQLCMLCVLYPEPEVLQGIFRKSWGLCVPISKKLLQLSKVTREARAKKL